MTTASVLRLVSVGHVCLATYRATNGGYDFEPLVLTMMSALVFALLAIGMDLDGIRTK